MTPAILTIGAILICAQCEAQYIAWPAPSGVSNLTYRVYRGDNPTNLFLLAATTNLYHIDVTAPVGRQVHYTVTAVWTDPTNPTNIVESRRPAPIQAVRIPDPVTDIQYWPDRWPPAGWPWIHDDK